jgi:Putative prokaryotic signal transducing protein
MKRISSLQSLADIGHLRNVLEQAGIRCLIKNEQLSGAVGEIPFFECMPELWILDEADLPRAERLLEEFHAEPAAGLDWRCSDCGEQNERQFAACWRCGAVDHAR